MLNTKLVPLKELQKCYFLGVAFFVPKFPFKNILLFQKDFELQIMRRTLVNCYWEALQRARQNRRAAPFLWCRFAKDKSPPLPTAPHFSQQTIAQLTKGDSYMQKLGPKRSRKFREMRRCRSSTPSNWSICLANFAFHTESAPRAAAYCLCALCESRSRRRPIGQEQRRRRHRRADNDAATCHVIFFTAQRRVRAHTRFIDYLFIELDVFGENDCCHTGKRIHSQRKRAELGNRKCAVSFYCPSAGQGADDNSQD